MLCSIGPVSGPGRVNHLQLDGGADETDIESRRRLAAHNQSLVEYQTGRDVMNALLTLLGSVAFDPNGRMTVSDDGWRSQPLAHAGTPIYGGRI